MKIFTRAVHVKQFFASLLLLLAVSLSYAQTTYTWIGPSGGSWATTTNWSPTRTTVAATDILQFNDGGTYSINSIPTTQTIRQLLITNNTTVNVAQTAAATLSINGPTLTNNLVVAQGSTFSLGSSTGNFTITMVTTASQRADISGTVNLNTGGVLTTTGVGTNLFTVSSTGVINHTAGTITASTATLNFAAGSNYNYLSPITSIAIPTATWDIASNCNITGVTTGTALTGFSGAAAAGFGNFTYNCPSQTSATFSLANALTTTTVKGDFNILSTGTGAVVVKSGTVAATLTVGGNLNLQGGQLTLNTGATAGATLTLSGDFNQSAGTFNMSSAAIACTINFDGNYNQTGGTFTQTSTTVSTINFRGIGKTFNKGPAATLTNTYINYAINTAGASLTLNSNIDIPASRTFTVTNGTLWCGTNTVTGAGTFTLTSSANATLGIGSPTGITAAVATLTGNIQTTTARTFGAAANYTYTGTNGQATGTGLPAALTGSLTVALTNPTDLITFTTTAYTSTLTLRMVSGGLANAITYSSTSSTLSYEGGYAQTTTSNEFPAASGPGRLLINNPSGVTLHAARSLPTAGYLTLTSGLLYTTSTNVLTILNTATTGVVGGSANSYVNGPLIRSLPGSLTGATSYAFPVGKGAYQVITLNPRTAAATTVTTEVFDASTGGTAGTGVASINSDNFWRVAASNGNLTTAGVVSVNETLLAADNKLCYATTQSGTYNIVPSTVVGDVLSSVDSLPQPAGASSVGYYVVGTPGTLSGVVPVGTSSSVQKLYQIANLLNTNTLTGDVVFELQADYDGTTGELFPINFYPFATSGGTWSATVRPAAGVSMLTTSGGTASTNLIVWDGVDRLTFDGRPGGVGSAISDSRWTLRNTTTSGATAFPTIKMIDEATYNTLQYCYVEGGNQAANGVNSGVIHIGAGTTTGNDFNTVAYNRVAPIATTVYNAIYSNSSLSTASNSDNTITGNEVFNFTNSGIEVNGTGNGSNWTISNNSVYCTSSTATNLTGITFNSNSATGNAITGNYVGGKTAQGGTSSQPWLHTGGTFTAITVAASNAGLTTVANNKVQNISVTSLATINGIIAAQGMLLVDNNTVGHATDATLGFTSATTTLFNGIVNLGSNNCTISNNTVANINGTGTNATGIFGIYSTYSSSTGIYITGNKVYNINTAGTGPLMGINTTATVAFQQSIIGNQIHSLYSTHASTAAIINGISFISSTTLANNNIKANLVHSLSAISSSTSTTIRGIFSAGSTGAATIANNMVRLGIDRNGSSITGAYIIVGMDHASTTLNNAYYFNSVQIAGTGVASTVVKTYAFRRTAGTTALNIRNNIFVNDRSNATTGGAHIGMGLSAITGVTSNNNLFNASGTGGALFELATTTYNTLAAWNTASTNQDLNSYVGAPGFINALGNASAVDLHINPSVPTQVEANAYASTGVTDDYDGDARTSPDIGADEGAFTPIDLTAPVITYSLFPNACNDVTSLNVTVTNITDASGVNTTTGTAPRVYYKKSTDANTYVDNTSATNGWKYVETTNTSAPYSFTIDFTKLNSPIAIADVIQYFVVAQDLATPNPPNVAINSGTAALAAATNTVNLTSAQFPVSGTPNQFNILPCTGTVTVGTGGNYGAFTTANGIFNAINQATLSGNLTINVVSDIAIEDGAVALNQWTESGLGGYTVTIQSSTNAVRDISSITAGYNGAAIATNGLFRLNGADRVTFNGGTGTNRYLTFRNKATGSFAATFNFIADATNNTINNCTIEGAPVNTVNGVIYFGTGTSTGNDNNTITSCDIRDLTTATATPTNAIFSLGSSAAIANTNTITNNNIYNYYAASGVSSGLLLSTNNTGWTVTGNRFYQTLARTAHAGDQIVILTTDGTGHNISNNVIGYADNAGGGTYTLGNGTTASRFIGMQLGFGTAAPYSTISNNQITNITLNTTSGGSAVFGIFSGIYLTAGNATISGNTIGSSVVNGAIKTTSTTHGATTNGIFLASTAVATTVSTNTIGGIDLTGGTSTANTGISFYGINMVAGNHALTGNTIGSPTLANSVRLISSNTTTNPSVFNGIKSTITSAYYHTISGNTIANITNTNTGTGATVAGIVASGGGAFTITGNNVYNLNTASASVGTTTSAAALGIGLSTSNTTALSITGNNIYNITCTGTANSIVTGIYYSGGTSTSNVVSKNLVYNLTSGTGTASVIYGIHLNATSTASNNMVRLGFNASGAPITTTSFINGIYKDGTAATKIFFNSVYIGGSGVGTTTTSHTYAFRKGVTSTPIDSIRNNIFVNERSNASTGSNHYAFWSINTTTIGSNYNLVYAPGSSVAFSNNGTNYSTQSAWNIATGHDGSSAVSNPNFASPTATVPDLHLASPSPAEGAGSDVASITDDFDGDIRASNTPVDIGADAAIVTQYDIYKPVITYTSIPTQAPCAAQILNVQITVSDNGSGLSLTANKPRMYLRKSVGSPTVAWGTYPSVEGTFASGNTNVSVWNFTVDFATLGISLAANDQFEYYFVAQDQAATPNIGYSQQNATSPVHNDVATQVTPPNFTLSAAGTFALANPLSGTVTVGTSGTYATFNGPSGLFNAINTRGLIGNLIVEVISDVNESGLYQPLGVIPEYCGTGYTILIRPSAAILRTVYSTSGGNPLISLMGCKRVTFDGAFGGSGSYLAFAQRQNIPNFYFNGVSSTATSYITIQNCTIEGNNRLTNSWGPGVINFAGLLGTGQAINNVTIDNNTIRNRTDLAQTAANTPYTLINMGGSTATNTPIKSDITISNNAMFNFAESAVQIRQNSSGSGIGNNIIITGNKIYQAYAIGSYQYPIWLESGNGMGHVISNNKIGGSALPNPNITGTWTNSLTDGEVVAIYTLNGGTTPANGTSITGNTISNITLSGTSYTNFIGIRNEGGAVAISNNTIGSTSVANNISNYGSGLTTDITANSATIGIWNQASEEAIISGNTVANMRAFYTSGVVPYQYVQGIVHGSNQYLNGVDYTNLPGGKVAITGNTVSNLSSGSLLASLLISPDALIGIFSFSANGTTGNEISGNTVYGLRATEGWTVASYNTRVYGIGVGLGQYGSTQSGTLYNNNVYDLNNNSRANVPEINGVLIGGGNWQVYNNTISISNSVYTSGTCMIQGLVDWMTNGRTGAYYHNSVYIGGTVTAGSNSSYAFCRFPDGLGNVLGANVSIKNNVFFNDRTGNSTNNIAIGNLTQGTSSDAAVGWNSDYNFIVTRNTGQVGRWVGTSAGDRTFANWQTTSGGDANSYTATITSGTSSSTLVNPTELFVSTSTGNLHINTTPTNAPYPYFFVRNRGTGIGSVVADIDGDPRDPSIPDLGCDEFTDCTTPTISLTANGASGTSTVCSGTSITLNTSASGSGSNCAGTYQYALSNGSLYWDGSAFASSTPVYGSSYNSISATAVAGTSYSALIACSADLTCKSNSNVVTVNSLGTVTSVSAVIGTPANGTSHAMSVSWTAVSGATGYDLDYSSNGSTWTNIASNAAVTTYSHNTGDNPNAPTYYRVRPRSGSTVCNYTQMTSPVYTACDAPSLPVLSNVTTTTLDLTLQPESPVLNPSYTTYSIFCPTTNQYVQANGTLGATEVFQTAAQWATITVTGLTLNTNYCFYATAQNMDGDKRSNSTSILGVQQFNSNVISNSVSSPTNTWWTPNSCTSGIQFNYVASGGCLGGAAEYSGTSSGTGLGCFLRSPVQNCSGLNEVVLECDLSNSFRAAHILNDYVYFNMFYGSSYAAAASINGVSSSQLNFDIARNCFHLVVKYDLTAVPAAQKSSILFYINSSHTSQNTVSYFLRVDNISISSTPTTACATTLNCTTPVITVQPTSPTAVCSGNGGVTISVATTGSGLSYQWRKNGSNVTAGGVYSVNSTASGSVLTITNGTATDAGSYDVVVSNACSQTVTSNTATYTVHTAITGLNATANTPVCEATDLILNATIINGTGVNYTWSGPNGYTASGSAASRISVVESTDEGVYNVSASNACGTVMATTTSVNIHPNIFGLVANTPNTQVCETDTLYLTASYIGTNIANTDVQWSWTGPHGFSSNQQNPFRYPVTSIDGGVYDVYATNACGTQNSGTPYISIDGFVEANAGPDIVTNVCGALTVQLGASGSGTWSQIGSTSSSFSPSAADSNANVTSSGYGLMQYRWTVTNGACVSEDDVRYYFNPAITTTISVEGCNFMNGDSVLISVAANGGSSTLSISPPSGSALLTPNVVNNTSIYTMPMDGSARSYTVSDGICSSTGTVTPPPTHPMDIPYKNAQGFATTDCYGSGYNRWLTFRDLNNDAILSVNDNGNNIGKVTASLYRDATEPVINQLSQGSCQGVGQAAMKRHFVLTSDAAQPFANDVSVRLYFTADELNDLVLASQANDIVGDDCTQYDNLTGLTDLYVTKYSGANEDGDYSNNAPDGIYRVYSEANSTMQTGANGFATLFNSGQNHHYVELNVREFSELWLHGSTTGSALPVEMLYLEADAINNEYIQVTWATAIEIENNGFMVERSTDAQNWSAIGWVDGNNNSTQHHNYAFDDTEIVPGTIYYYRLKQIDNDGAYEYTGVVSAFITATTQVLTIRDFIPNPAINTTQLVVISPSQQEISLDIFDAIGRRITSGTHQLNKGNNSIPFSVSEWAAGTYNAVVKFGNDVYSRKIVVIK